jgi:hypothetical protein
MALRFRDRLCSSSSVERGKTNSRDAQPDAWTIQPRITSTPGSLGFPWMAIECTEFEGTVTGTAFDSKETPEVLLGN